MVKVLHLLLCALLRVRIIPASEERLGSWTHTTTHTQLLTLPSKEGDNMRDALTTARILNVHPPLQRLCKSWAVYLGIVQHHLPSLQDCLFISASSEQGKQTGT